MKISYTQTFPKDAATVLKMFCDPAYHEKLQASFGAWDYKKVSSSDDGKVFRIKITYQVKSGVPLPGFAKKILGESSFVTQEEHWDRGSKKGGVAIQAKGLPAEIRATTSLADSGSGCTKSFNWDVNVKIPLVGGKIEQLIVDDIKSKVKPEEDMGRKLLAEY